MIHVGIDPGMHGAVAVIGDDYANVWDTPTVALERGREYAIGAMVDVLREFRDWPGRDEDGVHATLETGIIMPNKIEGRPDWKGQSARTTAVQWRGVGLWEGILAGLGIPYELAHPSVWKRSMAVSGDKLLCIVTAQRLFPSASHLLYRARDDGRAEALLLAEYGRRRLAGVPS